MPEMTLINMTQNGGQELSPVPMGDMTLKSLSSALPDVSEWREKTPFVADPNNPNNIRADGSLKGGGFLGTLKLPGGKVATEYTVGANVGGKEMDIPTLVPTLTKEEIKQVLDAASKNKMPPQIIIEKAQQHAEQRIKLGLPVFALPHEVPQ